MKNLYLYSLFMIQLSDKLLDFAWLFVVLFWIKMYFSVN